MPRVWARAAIYAILAIASASATSPARADDHGVPLPRGTRAAEGRHVSGLGFRATVDHYAKRWRADGIPVDAIGPYRVRGVDVMRFVRTDKAGEWLAVHVWRAGGVTWISVVPRPLDEPRSTE
ncbi:MAG: hypothetical protein K8M05_27495 [Deltaproteobacteria bacterium]|nr:hypothetical protein [Kofleriaceae bacterium]